MPRLSLRLKRLPLKRKQIASRLLKLPLPCKPKQSASPLKPRPPALPLRLLRLPRPSVFVSRLKSQLKQNALVWLKKKLIELQLKLLPRKPLVLQLKLKPLAWPLNKLPQKKLPKWRLKPRRPLLRPLLPKLLELQLKLRLLAFKPRKMPELQLKPPRPRRLVLLKSKSVIV